MGASAPTPAGWATHPWVEESASDVRFGVANGPRGDWPALAEFVAASPAKVVQQPAEGTGWSLLQKES